MFFIDLKVCINWTREDHILGAAYPSVFISFVLRLDIAISGPKSVTHCPIESFSLNFGSALNQFTGDNLKYLFYTYIMQGSY